jgi:hypothetical protein
LATRLKVDGLPREFAPAVCTALKSFRG